MISNKHIYGIFLNCQSLNNKLGEIKLLVYKEKPDFMAFNETWLNKYHPKFIGYSSNWSDRILGRGGRLGVIVRQGLQYSKIDLISYTQRNFGIILRKILSFSFFSLDSCF